MALLKTGGTDASALIHGPAGLALVAKSKTLTWAFQSAPQAGRDGQLGYKLRGKVSEGSIAIDALIYLCDQHADHNGWAAVVRVLVVL